MPPERTVRRPLRQNLPRVANLPEDFDKVACWNGARCEKLIRCIGATGAPLHPEVVIQGYRGLADWRRLLADRLDKRLDDLDSQRHPTVTGYDFEPTGNTVLDDQYKTMVCTFAGARVKDIVHLIRGELINLKSGTEDEVGSARAWSLRRLFLTLSWVSDVLGSPSASE